jgi:hypothetical protein
MSHLTRDAVSMRQTEGGIARASFKAALWAQYRKTLVGTQILIGGVTIAVLIQSHRVFAALTFWAVMQVGAILGAAWALRIRSRIEHARGFVSRA